mmetsp:Transcript_60190/g.140670  ORF Transcript_60190/g.140670 Transcript_60190/m.140670 type:complete len:335 (-) Transcript_60190:229-1233(-)
MAVKPRRVPAGHGRGLVRLLLACAAGVLVCRGFVAPSLKRSSGRRVCRRAVDLQTEPGTAIKAVEEQKNYTTELLEKLPVLVGKRNQSVNFTVVDQKLGTEVELKLPNLSYKKYIKNKGTVAQWRALPTFNARAESLVQAKEDAAKAALQALFRSLRTKANDGNNVGLAQLLASVFAEDVEVVELRYEATYKESSSSPGNALYALAFLSKLQRAQDPTKRVMAVSRVTKISSFPWVHKIQIQSQNRLVLPRSMKTFWVAVKTPPADLAKQVEKELRKPGAVTLRAAGTIAAQQTFLALANLTFQHRFTAWFSDDSDSNMTSLEVNVARSWIPIL